jgi:hypothetical protein
MKHKVKSLWWPRLLVCLGAALMIASVAAGTENGGSVYPVGVETVLPGVAPPPGGTMFYEFTLFLTANQLNDKYGNIVPIEFHLRFLANAVEVKHNWGVKFLGGTVGSMLVIPFDVEDLHFTPGKFTKFAVGNIGVSPLGVAYARGHWNFYYEGDLWFTATGRSANDPMNIGQNNYAVDPVGAITYLAGREELSSKFQYIVNLKDTATNYTSGNEFTWEFDGMHAITKKVAIGVNGYLYQQTTDDTLDNLPYNDGNYGRSLALGPEVRLNVIRDGAIAFKYLHDTLVQNRAPTNAFWFQMAIPISFGHRE